MTSPESGAGQWIDKGLTPEQKREFNKSRTLSDAEAIKNGAEFDDSGRLEPSRQQRDQARDEMRHEKDPVYRQVADMIMFKTTIDNILRTARKPDEVWAVANPFLTAQGIDANFLAGMTNEYVREGEGTPKGRSTREKIEAYLYGLVDASRSAADKTNDEKKTSQGERGN